jgi:hypothetical protein
MKVFITYASEERPTADELAVRLRTEGHTVFLDKDNLPEGEGYDAQIRAAIASCDLYLFLVSPRSVQPGRYTLTELKFAREQFPNPRGRVLPVMLNPTPFSDIPAYLGAVTVLQPQGNLVAETVAEVGAILQRRARARWLRIGAAIVAAALVLGAVGWWGIGIAPPSPCRLSASLTGSDAGGLALDITSPAGTTAFGLGGVSTPFELGPFKQKDFAWSIMLRRRNGSALGSKRTFSGCPQTRINLDLGEGYGLVIEPR